eukprot:Sdes_comp23842_c0_seq1m21982
MSSSCNLLEKIIRLCRRRGFITQSSEIFAADISGCYDFGPFGVELKNNIHKQWWQDTVYFHKNIHGLDTSILMAPQVWEASGHINNFSDPVSICHLSNSQFRADKASPLQLDSEKPTTFTIKAPDASAARKWKADILENASLWGFKSDSPLQIESKGSCLIMELDKVPPPNEKYPLQIGLKTVSGTFGHLPYFGFVSEANSPFVSSPRAQNLMFKTYSGISDPLTKISDYLHDKYKNNPLPDSKSLSSDLSDLLKSDTVYLRPETAQGTFSQFR